MFASIGTEADGVIPSAPNLCSAVQYAIAKHLCRRVEKAMIFLQRKELMPQKNRCLVGDGYGYSL